MEENSNKARKLFDKFQSIWNLEKVKNMTLEEYTSVDSDRDDFTYWLEHKLKALGSIKGNFSHTFGVYRRKSNEDKTNQRGLMYNNKYAWRQKYGNNENEAFKKVKDLTLQIIEASQNNNLEAIDSIDLGDLLKWKIAFHYQNPNDMKIFCIFSENTLNKIANGELGKSKLKTCEIYPQILENLLKVKPYKFDEVFSMSKDLWKKYNTKESQNNQFTKSNDSNQTKRENMTIPPLNQILYGPPGTGKTYSTIDKALEILRHYELIDEIPESREDKRAIFDEYRANKQIEFVTFHQSFSYEEFVEGIKPKLTDSNEGAESSEMSYTIKSGIFKKICKSALENLQDSQKDEATLSAENQVANLFEAFIEHIQNKQDNDIEYILNDEKNWFVSILNWGNYKVIKIFSDSGYLKKYPVFLSDNKIKRYYKDFKSNHNFKIPSKENRTGYIDTHRFYTAFFKKMQEFETTWTKHNNQTKTNIDNALKPYILIIDEINRGNISKILGELITLIEPSKRIGVSEELRVALPYSGNEFDNGNGFGVPSNLYIIGTMNTADRSIALLDTALRRRFEFVEMMPNCKELQKIWLVGNDEDYENSSIDEWNADEAKVLYEILTAINNRIEFLLDREHTIGHAFFFEKAIKKDGYFVLLLDSLKEIFAKKIIPLLQEYFYDDYAKIDAVLNHNEMVEIIETKASKLFPKKDADLDLEDKKIYKIKPFDDKIWNNPQTYINIYYNETTKPQSQDSNKSDAK